MKSIPSNLVRAGLAAGTVALLSACMYDPGAYQQPYGQAYGYAGSYGGGAYAQSDDSQYYAYAPAQDDAYLPYVADSDVVFMGGDTYIWLVGSDGHRYRRFYEHGDHRADVFQRRNEIRANGNWQGGGNPNWHNGGGNPNNWHGGDRSWGNNGDQNARGGDRSWGGGNWGNARFQGNAAAPATPHQQPMQGNPYRQNQQNQPPAQPNFARPNNAPNPNTGFNPNLNMGNREAQPRPRDEQRANPQVRDRGHWPYQQQ